MRDRTIRLAVAAMVLGLCGCMGSNGGPPLPLATVDLNRMYGGWYIVATMTNSFEKGMVAPYDVYAKRPDGDIQEDFYTHWGSFQNPLHHYTVHDWAEKNSNNARWRVQIVWPIILPFLVLYTDPDYKYVMFGEEDRKAGWIYSRTPTIPDADYEALRARFRAVGYDTSTMLKTVQEPGQIGAPGVWSDGIK